MYLLHLMLSVTGSLGGLTSMMVNILNKYTYFGVLFLMTLESASLPIPSEVILPIAGALASSGIVNVYAVLAFAVIGSAIGMAIDYYIAYFIGKDFVYNHLNLFRIKKESLEKFDVWFDENGPFAVFMSRLVPVIRGLISFPAGFAQMPKKSFFAYSIAGTIVWDSALIAFGYYAIKVKSLPLIISMVAGFALVLYFIYIIFIKKVSKRAAEK